MRILKRNGKYEDVKFDKITNRLKKLCSDLDVKPDLVAQKVLSNIRDGISTTEIDDISADVSISMMTDHPDYEALAARVLVSNIQKNHRGRSRYSKYIVHERDYLFDYFGIKTLTKSYLKQGETPQYMFMRVAQAVSDQDEQSIINTYNALSLKKYTHASPTLFNAGSHRPQMSSCFLCEMKDSLDAIYDTKKQCALISKYAGGIGIHIHPVRAKGSKIHGNGGTSDGIIPMLRTLNADARYCNQGSLRKGSYAIYLEPWHDDIFEFLELRLNQGDEESRCRDLFTALWVPDLFMKRLEKNEPWSLFCPNEAQGLSDVYGEEFEALYTRYEQEGKARRTVPIQDIWIRVIKSQVETGTPYILYKDHCNIKSNQKNLGTIKSSNLCVASETRVKTRKGERIIQLLEGSEVEVWNGREWSQVTVHKTSDASKLINVHVMVNEKRKVLTCTPNHIFVLDDGSRVEAHTLKTGDVLAQWQDENGVSYSSRVCMVMDEGRVSSTYCFTEPILNQGVFNGVLTGQCAEIIEFSDADNTAVCNLASMALPSFVKDGSFDFVDFEDTVKLAIKNLNNVIDRNYYPVPQAKKSNMTTRPIALGVQGLADVFAVLKYPFESPEAKDLNKRIFERMYFAAVSESCTLAEKYGPYDKFESSPASQGLLQFDLWGVPHDTAEWNALKERVKAHGLRNSLLIGLMPTASTSQILGYNECFEPFTTNIYLRRTLAGEFIVLNKYLVRDLIQAGLWDKKLKNEILRQNGSIQNIPEIPDNLKKLYKTVWEMSQRCIIDMARDRGIYVCQSQSMNLFVDDPTNARMSSIHMYAWKQGLKTGMYYLRTRPKIKAQQVTLEPVCTMCSA
jgi:ribonucleotide reductase alpha subunit